MEDVTEVRRFVEFGVFNVLPEFCQGLEFVRDLGLDGTLLIVLFRLEKILHHLISVDEALHLCQFQEVFVDAVVAIRDNRDCD